jgi:DNA polymerase-3 subunit alpha
MSKPFVHLHLHTKYSMLDGACHLKPLLERAETLGMPAVAMTDHGVMYGARDFFNLATETPVKPIIGCEVYINARASLDTRDPNIGYHHLILLAADDEGYQNLIRLNTISHLEGFYYRPRIDKVILAKHAKGLICLSGCIQGEVNSHIRDGNLLAAKEAAREYNDIFGENNFFLEMQDHGIPEQKKINVGMRELEQELGIPTVVTNDVHYLLREHAQAHEMMVAIQTGTVMSDPKRLTYEGDNFYMKTRGEMERIFPDDSAALDRTVEIAQRCVFEFPKGVSHYPRFDPTGETDPVDELTKVAHAGLRKLYGVENPDEPANDFEKKLLERFNHEVTVIKDTGFCDYFLVVSDLVRFARNNGIPVGPGRGSGGGSVVAYAMEITEIEPLRYNLIFERFLNPERVSPPDFDIDFCKKRRSEVIDYVVEKYGADHVALIATFGQLAAKNVIRDLARVMEIPLDRAIAFTKLVPDTPGITLEQAVKTAPEFAAATRDDPDLARIMPHAYVLEGLYRNVGTHAAGVVIGDRPLRELVPLTRDREGTPMTQYDKDAVEDCGLLKMDFLGLRTLTVLDEAVRLVKEIHGKEIKLNDLPPDDPATFKLLNRGDTKGVFQLESPGMVKLISEIGIGNLSDMIAVIALFRPGPMEMLPSYSARKTGKEPIKYDHPLLEPILKETYGIMVYQEQVQRAANVLAGYSYGQADLLRRAMGKKKPEIMDMERANFVKGCADTNNIPKALAEKIFNNIAAFAGYGFNQAHSVGYAIIAYQTAYMKANYPVEFMAAQISSEIGNFDKMPGFVMEAIDMGMPVLRPDVNRSIEHFSPEGDSIRFGLAGIKSVGEGAAAAIVAERKRNGEFKGLIDFCERVDSQSANRRVLEALTRCGAMDGFGQHRAQLFNAIDFAMARARESQLERQSGQQNLFDAFDVSPTGDGQDDGALPDCEPWTQREALTYERELLGVYLSGNPLDRYRGYLNSLATCSIPEALAFDRTESRHVRICGLVTDMQRRIAKASQKPWAIITIEDGNDRIESLMFNQCYNKFGAMVEIDRPLLVCGELNMKDGRLQFLANEVFNMPDAIQRFTCKTNFFVKYSEDQVGVLKQLQKLMMQYPGSSSVTLCLMDQSGRRVLVEAGPGLRITPEVPLIEAAEKLLGRGSVRITCRDNTYMEYKIRRQYRPQAAYHS